MCASNAAAARNTQIKLSRVCIVGLSDGFGHRGIQRTDFGRTVGALVRARRILAGSSPPGKGVFLAAAPVVCWVGERDCGTDSAVCAEGRL